MDMDNDDSKHETQIDRAEMSDRHETSDGTAPGSGPWSMRRSHAVMPPLVPDGKDGKTVIRPTGEG
jgi:hypothetical protein